MTTAQRALYAGAALFAVIATLLIGAIDLHTSEVVVTMVLVFALSMLLGAIAPRGGWYWAILSTVGVPLLNLFPAAIHVPPNPNLPREPWSYLFLIFLLLLASVPGMLFGVIVRRTMHIARQ